MSLFLIQQETRIMNLEAMMSEIYSKLITNGNSPSSSAASSSSNDMVSMSVVQQMQAQLQDIHALRFHDGNFLMNDVIFIEACL